MIHFKALSLFAFIHQPKSPQTLRGLIVDSSSKKWLIPFPIQSKVAYQKTSRSSSNCITQLNQSPNKDQANVNIEEEEPLQVLGVTLKMAFDENYAVADNSEEKSERFTCSQSLDLVHKLRRCSDAVLVGRGTVERDNCTLTVRRVSLWKGKGQPTRVVLDPKLKSLEQEEEDDGESEEYKYALLKDGMDTIIYHGVNNDDDVSTFSTLEKQFKLVKIDHDTNNDDDDNENNNNDTSLLQLSTKKILHDLQTKQNIHHVMVEGGPATAKSFLSEKVIDRAIIIRAPVKFIEPVPSGMSNDMLRDADLELVHTMQCGSDTVEFWSKVGMPWPVGNGIDLWDWPC